jgi:hypothetical protein
VLKVLLKNATETIELKGCSLCQRNSSPTEDKSCGTDIHDWNFSELLKITSVFQLALRSTVR